MHTMTEAESRLIKTFLQHLEDRGRKEKTQMSYASAHRSLCEFFSRRNNQPHEWKLMTGFDMRIWKSEALKAGALPSTINHRIIFSQAYSAWLHRSGHLSREQYESLSSIPLVQTQKLGVKVLEPNEFGRFLRNVELSASKRDRAIIALLLSGLRESEVVGLTYEQIILTANKGSVQVAGDHVKGSAYRIVPLNRQTRIQLHTYLDGHPGTGPVFSGERGPLTENGIYKIVRKYGEAVGVKTFPHLLRHHCGEMYLQANPGDLVGLQALLGHSEVATTARHYARKRLSALEENVEKMDC